MEKQREGWHWTNADGNTLTRDSDGNPYKTQRNVRLSIRMTGAKLAYNEFTDRLEIKGFEGYGPELTDEAVTAMWLRIDDRLGLRPFKSFFQDIAFDLCRQYAYNPLTDCR